MLVRFSNTKTLVPVVVFALQVVCAPSVSAQADIQAKFDGTDIRQVIEAVAEIRGEQFVVHPDVKGAVTLELSAPVTVEVFYEIFISILQDHGYEITAGEGVIHIHPIGIQPRLGEVLPASLDDSEIPGETIRFVPYIADGKTVGFRLYPGINRAAFFALGFNAGDLVVEYDGKAVSDETALTNLFESMNAGQVDSIKVDRVGELTVIQMP